MIDSTENRFHVRRGSQLPHAKLTEDEVRGILLVVEHRDRLKRQLAEMTNAKLAERYGVHRRTIDRITAGENWIHVLSHSDWEASR